MGTWSRGLWTTPSPSPAHAATREQQAAAWRWPAYSATPTGCSLPGACAMQRYKVYRALMHGGVPIGGYLFGYLRPHLSSFAAICCLESPRTGFSQCVEVVCCAAACRLTTVRTYSDTGRTMPPLTASDCTASQCVRRYYVAEGINPAPFSHAVCYNVTTDTFLGALTHGDVHHAS